MSAFREHFLDKYFGYRRRYVGAVAELAPHRRSLAVLSELARLGFSCAACALVVFIASIVFVRSVGHGSWGWTTSLGLLVLLPLVFLGFGIVGLRAAWLDRGRPGAPPARGRRVMDATDREIADLFERKRPRGLARAISRAEAGFGAALMQRFFPLAGRATTIGLTGPPGVGKSTLCNALVATVRATGKTVGVISVDPSSPFSHGAILGDRIRLTEHFTDPDVFIRSMASRGHLGGLAGATGDAVALMDAFGMDVVIVETVGVGQSEIEIAELADTTLVALQPGSGDSVQLLKAGILEVADIFVVNKADHPMALVLQREIRSMMEMLDFTGWVPELVATRARENVGVTELWAAIERHRLYLEQSGDLAARRRSAFAHRVRSLVLGDLERRLAFRMASLGDERTDADPYAVARRVSAEFGLQAQSEPGPARPREARPRSTVKGL